MTLLPLSTEGVVPSYAIFNKITIYAKTVDGDTRGEFKYIFF